MEDAVHVLGAAEGVLGALDDFEHFGLAGVGVEFSGLFDGDVVIQASMDDQDGSVQLGYSLA